MISAGGSIGALSDIHQEFGTANNYALVQRCSIWLYFSRGSAKHRAGRSCRRRTTLLLRNTGEDRYLWLG